MKTIVDYASKVKEQHALNKTLAPVETDLTDASRAYAIGEQFIYDGDLFKAKTAIAQHDALVLNTNYEAADDITTQIKNKTVTTDSVPTEGSTNPVQSNGVFVENRNIYAVMGEMGAKNLLPFDLDEIKAANTEGTWAGNVYTRRNVSFTVNSDYSVDVVADGITNTQASGFFYYSASGAEKFVGKSVTLTGCPISGGSSTYNLQAYRAASVDGSGGTEKDTGSGVTLDWMNNGTGIKAMVAISIGAEVSCNAKFKPMLRYAEDIDSTYQPYAKTNQQLTAENEALTNKLNNEIVTRSELGAKNLLPYDIQKIKALNTAGTWNGNTYTPNNSSLNITLNTDGSITVDGTSASAATATLYIYGSASEANENIFKGMIASGCPSGGATNKYSLAIQGFSTTTPSGGNNYHDIGEGITVGNDNYVRVYVRIQNNTTVSNLTFKPMIRLASDPDATYQPYAKTNQELTAENQTLTNNVDVLMDNGAVNLLPNDASTTTINGITYTVNNDGTVTANGTASAVSEFNISTLSLDAGDYVLSSGNALPANVYFSVYITGQGWKDITNGADSVAFTSNSTMSISKCRIYVAKDVVLTNFTFKPMIADAKYNGGYVPYAKTNRELTNIVDGLFNGNGELADIHFASETMKIYMTSDVMPDFDNLTTQDVTDIAQGMYDFLKKIEDKTGVVSKIWMGKTYLLWYKKSDGTQISSGNAFCITITNAGYSTSLADNTKMRMSMTMFQYGLATINQYAIWGQQFRMSRRGLLDTNDATKECQQDVKNYNTINSFIG